MPDCAISNLQFACWDVSLLETLRPVFLKLMFIYIYINISTCFTLLHFVRFPVVFFSASANKTVSSAYIIF